MEGRRTLAFANLDEMMAEVDRLLHGHKTLGGWSLGQVCNHLTDSLRFTIEGYPARAPWPIRKLVGPILKRKILGSGRFPSGMKTPKAYWPRPGLDARAEAEALRAAVRHFAGNLGPTSHHPVIDGMTAAESSRLLCIHAAHHLGFVVPEPA